MAEKSTKNKIFDDKVNILKRWEFMKSERSSWFSHWQELTKYLLPRNGRYFAQDRDKGMRRHTSIYDNTGTRALRTLAAGLMGGLTSPARPWFRLTISDHELAENHNVKEWLADATEKMLEVFAKSNTYRALHSMYEELGCFGTAGAIIVKDERTCIRLFPLTIGEYAIATNWKGEVTTVYREFEKPVGEIVKEFGLENCSSVVKTMYGRGQLETWITIVHAIEPREDRDPKMLDNINMEWRSIYYEKGGDPDKKLRESGFKRFPGVFPRWAVAGGDIYGNSPGMEALGDIKQLQQEQLRKAQGIDYMTNPPLQVPSQLINRDVERLPGGITYYDSQSGSQGIKTMFDVRLDLNHLLVDIQDVRGRIGASFYADLFLMLANQTDVRMTATEVAERHEEKMLMLGPVLERLHNELLDPLISITFEHMMEQGLLPPFPPEMQGAEINVELMSMLAQAQRAIATNGIDRFMGALGQVAQFKPEVLDKINADAWVDNYSDMLGVDPEILLGNDEVAAIRQQRAEQQAKEQQSAMMNQAADTAQKLGNAPTQSGQSTALDDVTRMFSGYN